VANLQIERILSPDHPLVKCVKTKQFGIAFDLLKKSSVAPSEKDGMTLTHYLFMNYDGSERADKLAAELVKREDPN